MVLDANHDGIISADEIAAAPEALKKLDKNGDGQLTQDELRPQRPPPPQDGNGGDQGGPPPGQGDGQHDGPPPGPPPGEGNGGNGDFHPPVPPLMAALDTNGDGILSADEIANTSASLLKLDKNGDGQLTPDEYRPAGGPGRGHLPPQKGGGN
jgi:hypothetical protein